MFSDDDKLFISIKQMGLFFPLKYGTYYVGSLNDKTKNLWDPSLIIIPQVLTMLII